MRMHKVLPGRFEKSTIASASTMSGFVCGMIDVVFNARYPGTILMPCQALQARADNGSVLSYAWPKVAGKPSGHGKASVFGLQLLVKAAFILTGHKQRAHFIGRPHVSNEPSVDIWDVAVSPSSVPQAA